MKIAFLISDNDKNTSDIPCNSNWSLANVAQKRGHRLFYLHPNSFCRHQDATLTALLSDLIPYQKGFRLKNPRLQDLEAMDVIFARHEPPVTMQYITWLYMLESLKHPLVTNPPKAIRDLPEKLLAPPLAAFTPEHIITSYPEAIKSFLKKHKTAVIKPLYDFQGRGVHLITEETLHTITIPPQSPVVCQQFLPQVKTTGDKKIIFIQGNPIGAFLRIPTRGIQSSVFKGAKILKTSLSKKEQQIAKVVATLLKKHNVLIAGMDCIHDKLTELNVTCQAGFHFLERFTNKSVATMVLKILEKERT